MTGIRYIFQALTRPKLLDWFQPNLAHLFYRVLATILLFQIFQNGRHLIMAAVQKGSKRGTPKPYLNVCFSETTEPNWIKLGMLVETY